MIVWRAGAFVVAWLTGAFPTPRRLAVLAAFVVVFPLVEAFVWLCWLGDAVLFRRRAPVRRPVFIVGNFRSGTTYLHRLLAVDAAFSAMPLWESLLAPSRTGKFLLAPFFAGRPRTQAAPATIHHAGWREPEEDDYLLLHRFSALTVGLASGLVRLAAPYVRFDQAAPGRRATMRFYRQCLQKHLATAPPGARYLAKNPAMTPKLAALFDEFPDASVIVLERDPREVLPSLSSMMRVTWNAVGAPPPPPAFLEDLAAHWYAYARNFAADQPSARIHFLRYEDLLGDPLAAVTGIYHFLDSPTPPAVATAIAAASRHISRHRYTLENEGFDPERVATRLGAYFSPPHTNSAHG